MLEALIEELVVEKMGEKPIGIERMTFGHQSTVYDVSLPSKSIILRFNENPKVFERTRHNISVLRQLGLPTPTVIHSNLSHDRYPAYMILAKIPGRDLRFEMEKMSKAELSQLAEQIVSYQQLVAQLPKGEGYGWVPIGYKGDYQSWADIVFRDLNRHIDNIENQLSKREINRLLYQAEELRTYFDQVEPVCFLDDITIKNVMILDGKLQGLIDLDWVCYGDPLYMVGLTQTAILSDINEEAIYYIDQLCQYWSISKQMRNEVVNFYSMVHALEFIGFHKQDGNLAAIQRLVKGIKTWLAV